MLVSVNNLTKIYRLGDYEVYAVRNVFLNIDRGEFVAVTGHSGSGKSTLLSLIGGLSKPTVGRVKIDGVDIWELGDEELSALRNRKIGFMFQFSSLLPTLSVRQNMLLPAFLAGADDREAEARARELLEQVGMEHRMHAYPWQLSGGEQRRVAVARAFMNHPELILADEPTGDLDEDSEALVMRMLRRMNREEGTAVLLVTHSRELAEQAERRLVMRRGRLLEVG